MNKQIKLSLLLPLMLVFCSVISAQSKSCSETCNNGYKHNYLDCIDGVINYGRQLEDMGVEFFNTKVSRSEEIELGEASLRDSQKKFKFITTGAQIDNLKSILRNLSQKVQKPQGFTFSIYLINSDMVNAWTCGGKIFFTTAMYEFCNNNSEIACIIGHEISHNLLGHVNHRLKKYKTANQFGMAGQIAGVVGMYVTSSFGQEDEAHSDLLGVDLAYSAGYKACESITLWNRMKDKSGEYNQIANFMSSHPHPEKRAECLSNHIQNKYSTRCGN